MIDEKNKETENTSTGNFGGGQAKTGGSFGTSNQPAKDTFSASGNKSVSESINLDSAKETAKGLIDQAKSTAGQAYGVAAEKATSVIDEKKTDLASGLTSVADTIRQVSSTLRETDEQSGVTDTAAKYSDSLAKQIEQISDYFEQNDVRAMISDVERFARRNPAVFIGGAFAVGLLVARFLKSSGSGQNSPRRLQGRNYDTPLLKAKNDSTNSSEFGNKNLGTAGKHASEGITGIAEESATGNKPSSGTANTSPGATDYKSGSSDSGKSSTGASANDSKQNFGDNKVTNPS
ncbi:MAG: hypothetical protein H0U50_10610 [Pyrinomonadaceae bacterium]|nr:hypothetical protein [Pyrinomonadaceae bacterium]